MRHQKDHIYHWLAFSTSVLPRSCIPCHASVPRRQERGEFRAFHVFKIENNVSAIHNALTPASQNKQYFKRFHSAAPALSVTVRNYRNVSSQKNTPVFK